MKNNSTNNYVDTKYNSDKILGILFLNRKLIIIVNVCFVIIGLIYALLATEWFETKIKIMPSTTNDNPILRQYANVAAMAGVDLPIGNVSSQHFFYPEILKSDLILNDVLENKFNTDRYKRPVTLFELLQTEIDSSEENWKFKLYERAKKKLRNEYIKTDINELTQLLTVTIYAPHDRRFTAELANFLIKRLDNYNKNIRKTKAKEKKQFIQNAVRQNIEDLREAEEKLKEFKEQNKNISSPEKELMLRRLQTDVEIYRTIVIELRKQLELVKIEEINETPTINIIEPANKPLLKSKPKRALIVLLFGILGLSLSLIYVIINEIWKTNKSVIKEKYYNLKKHKNSQ